MRGLVGALALLAALGVAVGFLGRLHPFFDSVGHFRHHAAAAALLLGAAALFFDWRVGAVTLLAAVAALASVAPYHLSLSRWQAERAPGDALLLQMNLRFDVDPRPALGAIARHDPDILVLQEMSAPWADALSHLSARYPHAIACDRHPVIGAIAILSRHPFAGPPLCVEPEGLLLQDVLLDGQRVTVGGVHLAWPFPHAQWRDLPRIVSALEAHRSDRGVLITGDFNALPWSAAVRSVARASGTSVVRGIGATWPQTLVAAPIAALAGLQLDNVLASDGVRVIAAGKLPPTASDHSPILVRFRLSP